MKEICVKINGCKKITITDNYDWEEIVPATSVVNTLITLKYISSTATEDVITIVDETEYVSTIDVLPATILASWTKIEDGYYQIKITYTLDDDSTVKINTEVFNKCNMECKLDKFIADYIENSECDSCNKEKQNDILNMSLKSTLLCYAITCSTKTKVWELYNYINNMLTEYNCSTC